ncbi:hypothetical protein R6Q59_027701 [Mikania micrantha]
MKIISQETIKPSSPTPSHLKTHVLSLVDNFSLHVPVPFIFFYKNYKDGDISNLKKSLSLCLTQYYPFAGRFLDPNACCYKDFDTSVYQALLAVLMSRSPSAALIPYPAAAPTFSLFSRGIPIGRGLCLLPALASL